MSFSAKSYSLGSSGTLVEMHIPPPSSSGPSCSTEPATPIIILDQSGSMGQWATRFPPILSEALASAGFPGGQRAEFVTFATGCAHSTTTVRGLHRKGAESRGNTNMAPAVERLRRLLAASDPGEEFQLVVVSDGCVNDLPRVLAAADGLRAECAAAGRTIDASLVRLLTSRHGAPDTRAVSCLGQLAATRVDVLDLYGMDGCDERARTNMAREIRKTLRGCNKRRVGFSRPVSASLTGRGARASSLTFNEGPNYLMIPQDVDVSNLQVKYNGRMFDVEKHSGTFGEEDIRGFLKFVEGKMRMLAVVETATARQTLAEMSDWLSGVEQALSSMVADSEEEKKEADAADYTLASRKKVVVAKVLKSQKGLINSLKRLANADAVADLNSQQKADFLRGVSNNKSGRGLARRAARSAADMTPDELAADGVRNLAAARIPMHEEDAAIKSFYSFASAPECLALASELTRLEGASAVDVLQLIGLPGISFAAPRANYVDPWTFRVQHVFTGDSSLLSQSDLWHSMNNSGGSGELRPPGFNTAITGVDPLRHPNPYTYDVYVKAAAGINKLHASVSMRGLVAPIPDDEHAIKTAVALNLIHVCANAGGSESVFEKLEWEIHDLETLPINNTIRKHMLTLEPGAYFSGDLGIGNVMRLYSALLGWKWIVANSRQRQRILRDMYSLAVYHKLKHVENRKEAIGRLLGIDLARDGTYLPPIHEPNPPDPVHCSEFSMDEEVTNSFDVLSPNEGALVMRARELVDSGDSLAKLGESLDIEAAYGVENITTWKVAIMVQALKCKKASDRLDTEARKMLIEDLTTSEQCRSFLSAVARDAYRADYERRLRQKTAEEDRIRMMKLVKDVIDAESMKTFIELMQHIPNRSSEAYGLVLETLLQSSAPPLRFNKLWICILGRGRKGRPVWNDGNCLVGDLAKYRRVFCESGEAAMWKELRAMRARFPIHKYRNGAPNRHGHSNDFPSFYIWGYLSLEKFKEGVDEATFKDYCVAHAKRGCCGLV